MLSTKLFSSFSVVRFSSVCLACSSATRLQGYGSAGASNILDILSVLFADSPN